MDAALVLAGGRSQRFAGEEKSLATLEGDPMIRRVVASVVPLVDTVVVSCRVEQRDVLGDVLAGVTADVDLEFAFDDRPDRGPVCGLREGLRVICGECGGRDGDESEDESDPEDTAIVVACDLPLLESTLFESLEDHLGEADAVIPATSDGQRHPLAGLYRVSPTLEAITTALGDHDQSDSWSPGVFDVLSRLETVTVRSDRLPRDVDRLLRNVNTRAELDALESRLEAEAENRT